MLLSRRAGRPFQRDPSSRSGSEITGFFGTIKGWLNIGGVKVKIEDLSQVVPKDGSHISAKVNLTTKDAKTVNKVLCKFLLKKSTGSGESKETKEYVIAQRVITDGTF